MSLQFIRGVAERALRVAARLLANAPGPVRASAASIAGAAPEPDGALVSAGPVPAILDPSVPTADLPVRLQLLRAVADGRAFRPSDVGAIIGREMTVESSLVYIRKLTGAGYVQRDGDMYRITPAGLAVVPVARRSAPYVPAASGLSLAALEYLVAHGPAPVSEIVAHTERSRQMYARMKRLRKRGWVVTEDGLERVTEAGRAALERGRSEEVRHGRVSVHPTRTPLPASRPKREPAPIRIAEPRATPEPAPRDDAATDLPVLPALSHGQSMRLRELVERTGMDESAARAEISRLRLAGHIHRTAPDTWQITHSGQCHLRGVPMRPRAEGPVTERAPDLTAAIAEHVARRGVTRLPGAGTEELERSNRRRGVYHTSAWGPKTIQQRRRERLAR